MHKARHSRRWASCQTGPDRVRTSTSSGFFRTLGARPLLGRTLGEEDDRERFQRHAIIGYRYWRERFGGDQYVIGKTIKVDTSGRGGGVFQVIGVMPPEFDMPHNAQLWLSLGDWGAGPMPALDATERCCN